LSAGHPVKGGDPVDTFTGEFSRNSELTISWVIVMDTNNWVSFGTQVDEVTAVDPFLLQKFDGIEGPGANEHEINTAVLFDVFGSSNIRCPAGTKSRGATDNAFNVDAGHGR